MIEGEGGEREREREREGERERESENRKGARLLYKRKKTPSVKEHNGDKVREQGIILSSFRKIHFPPNLNAANFAVGLYEGSKKTLVFEVQSSNFPGPSMSFKLSSISPELGPMFDQRRINNGVQPLLT